MGAAEAEVVDLITLSQSNTNMLHKNAIPVSLQCSLFSEISIYNQIPTIQNTWFLLYVGITVGLYFYLIGLLEILKKSFECVIQYTPYGDAWDFYKDIIEAAESNQQNGVVDGN